MKSRIFDDECEKRLRGETGIYKRDGDKIIFV